MKRETILSILLNVTFVMCIFAVRYFYVKKESTISALYILANNIIDKVIKYEKVKKNGSN